MVSGRSITGDVAGDGSLAAPSCRVGVSLEGARPMPPPPLLLLLLPPPAMVLPLTPLPSARDAPAKTAACDARGMLAGDVLRPPDGVVAGGVEPAAAAATATAVAAATAADEVGGAATRPPSLARDGQTFPETTCSGRRGPADGRTLFASLSQRHAPVRQAYDDVLAVTAFLNESVVQEVRSTWPV